MTVALSKVASIARSRASRLPLSVSLKWADIGENATHWRDRVARTDNSGFRKRSTFRLLAPDPTG
jgi:hypothetical protein